MKSDDKTLGGGVPPAPGGALRALFIGVDAYLAVNPLRGCVNDILAIRNFLLSKAAIPSENTQLLLAPSAGFPLPADVGTPPPPTRANILAAFQALEAQAQQNDQVVIYYAGHGTRITNPANPNEHIGAIVPVDAKPNGTNFVINKELNEGIGRVVAKGARVTAIFDACHSGGATRELEFQENAPSVREVQLDPKLVNWDAVKTAYGLDDAAVADEGTRGLAEGGAGWILTADQRAELIVVSGCRDVQLSHEYVPPGTTERHGALTFFIMDALKGVQSADTSTLTWLDIFPQIRGNVETVFKDQTPTLEGRAERPVFGGRWTPYEPGFTVTVQDGGLEIDGGDLHGLGVGAQVAIYPKGTARFDDADPTRVLVEVVSATPVVSQATVISGDAGRLTTGARAKLIKPGRAVPKIKVALKEISDELAAGIRSAPGINDAVELVAPGSGADVELRPRLPIDGRAGWVLVKYVANEASLGPNDVIAYAEPDPNPFDQGQKNVGPGLVHWARYQAILTRHNTDPTLKNALGLDVLVGPDNARRPPNASGIVEVREDEVILLTLRVTGSSPTALNVALLSCSDDGNIDLFWPPENADNVLRPGEEKTVGLDGPNHFTLPVRDDQTASRYTFKIFAANKLFNTRSLTLESMVQDFFGARGSAKPPQLPETLWTTLEVPVLIQRAGA